MAVTPIRASKTGVICASKTGAFGRGIASHFQQLDSVGQLVGGKWHNGGYWRDDIPFGTHSSEAYSNSSSGYSTGFPSMGGSVLAVGKQNAVGVDGANEIERRRNWFQWQIPSGVSILGCNLRYTIGSVYTVGEGWTGKIYSSNTDDSGLVQTPGYGGFVYNLNNLLGSFASTVTTGVEQVLSIDPSLLSAFAGGYFCLIFGTDHELAGTGASTAGLNSGWNWPGNTSDVRFELIY